MKNIIESDLNLLINSTSATTIQNLIDALVETGMQVYVVGGAPREWLLSKNARDIDLAVNFPVQTVYRVCESLFSPEILILKKNFGLVTIVGDVSSIDISIMKDFNQFDGNIEDCIFTPVDRIELDYLFRDFSINCFYYNSLNRTITNPVSEGFSDLEKRILRLTMGQKKVDLDRRICIRILQFMARDYHPADATLALLKERLDTDISNYSDFEKWLAHYIKPDYAYTAEFVALALKFVSNKRSKEKLLCMFELLY